VISSRRGFHPAGPGGGWQGTLSRLAARLPVWLPSWHAGRRSPPLVPFPLQQFPGPPGLRANLR